MGKYNRGILGSFKGKIGTVVGSNWNGVNYMRSLPENQKDPKTEKQMAVRQRFALVNRFLKQFKPLIAKGFRYGAGNVSAMNRASSYHIRNAITGTYPDQEFDVSKLILSRGELTGIYGASASSDSLSELTISWEDNTGDGSASAGDTLSVAVYSVSRNSAFIRDLAAVRSDETVSLTLPPSFKGDDVQVYLFFASEDETLVSDTSRLGPVTVLTE